VRLAADVLAYKSAAQNGWERERERELAEMLSRQVRNLDLMLQDLLDTSRIEAGQLELRLTLCDIAPLLRDAVALHQGGAELHNIVLELSEKPLLCHCDSLRLSQVLNNLLSNAIKYSPNGGLIVVKAVGKPDEIEVVISDQGIGIQPDELGNIFKPFQRTEATRETIPGIGLGLSASRRIVRAHGGTLEVESTPGEGSTFKVVLPRKGLEASALPDSRPKTGPPSPSRQ
jgi:two-component system sensor histidine kinase MtrB